LSLHRVGYRSASMKNWARLAAAIALAASCTFSFLPSAGAGAATGGLGVMIPAHPGRVIPTSNATEDSLNWSGYAVTNPAGHKITKVTSTFVVPAVNSTTPGFGATWTGIGGFNTSDLIQAGTAEEYIPGLGPNYYAWYEILPASETDIAGNCATDSACTVRPGDTVTITIATSGNIQSNQAWTISMTDAGHWTFTKTLNYPSTYSSAEWILEAPTVGVQTVMPMMANTLFEPNSTFTLDGGTTAQNLGTGSPVEVTMNQVEGIPSAIDGDGDGFTACAYALSCPTPAS